MIGISGIVRQQVGNDHNLLSIIAINRFGFDIESVFLTEGFEYNNMINKAIDGFMGYIDIVKQ